MPTTSAEMLLHEGDNLMTERELGALDARMTAMEKDMKGMRCDVREIRDALLTVRGGKKALLFIVGVSATVGGLAASMLPSLFR